MAEENYPSVSATLEPKLLPFAVKNVEFTGVEIDRGAYGVIHEVKIAGAICAAKQLHEELSVSDDSEGETSAMLKLVISECVLLSSLHHPNIVQFFGITTVKDSRIPILLMEKLEGCLHSKLESPVNISFVEKRSFLLDVAHGLAYLHSLHPPVIHRDLTARNILLSSEGKAKIADLGVARILNLQVGKQVKTMTNAPGNMGYMPPEALEAGCKYNASIDVFSFGHLALFTVTRVFPELLAPTYPHPKKDKVLARSEIERRKQSFDAMYQSLGDKHPLLKLVSACLQNKPSLRPSTAEIADSLETLTIKEETQGDRLWAMPKQELMFYVSIREKEMERMANELSKQQVLLKSQEDNTELSEKRISEVETQNQQLKAENQQLDSQNHILQTQNQHLQAQNKQLFLQVASPLRLKRSLSTGDLLSTIPLNPDTANLSIKSMESPPISHTCPGTADIQFPSSLHWRKLEIPPSIRTAPIEEMVTIGDSIYVRCGKNKLAKFTPSTNTWVKIPTPDVGNFICRIVELEGQLVVIEDAKWFQTHPNKIFVWNEKKESWATPFPCFQCPQVEYSAISYKHYLIIIGGNSIGSKDVKILDTKQNIWYLSGNVPESLKMKQLPYFACKLLQIDDNLIVCHYCVLLNAEKKKKCFSVNLPQLIAHTTAREALKGTMSFWTQLSDLPHYNMTLATAGGALLAMGGLPESITRLWKGNKNIYAYNPDKQQWVAISEPPVNCSYSTMLSGDILVTDSKMQNAFVGHLFF